MTAPAVLVGDERGIYTRAADRARMAYRRKHGAAVQMSRADRIAWNLAHTAPMAAAADRSGMTAVRKSHTARVAHLATVTAPDRIGGPASGDFLAALTRDAEHATARLEILAPAKPARKAPARKLAAVETVAPVVAAAVDSGRMTVTTVGRDGKVRKSRKLSPVDCVPVETTAPATVPAPMPAMTRAARKATRRELAATMRAEGLRPEGAEWIARCAAAGLPIREEVTA